MVDVCWCAFRGLFLGVGGGFGEKRLNHSGRMTRSYGEWLVGGWFLVWYDLFFEGGKVTV